MRCRCNRVSAVAKRQSVRLRLNARLTYRLALNPAALPLDAPRSVLGVQQGSLAFLHRKMHSRCRARPAYFACNYTVQAQRHQFGSHPRPERRAPPRLCKAGPCLHREASGAAKSPPNSRYDRVRFLRQVRSALLRCRIPLSIASEFRGDESPNIYIKSIEMNNRDQQTTRATAPSEATPPTYLNVFTVEEYENNGKTRKKWTKIGAAFPHKEGTGFSPN
jgi:hypothetical protein